MCGWWWWIATCILVQLNQTTQTPKFYKISNIHRQCENYIKPILPSRPVWRDVSECTVKKQSSPSHNQNFKLNSSWRYRPHKHIKDKNRTVVSRSFSQRRFRQNTDHGSTQVARFAVETQQKICVTTIDFSWDLKRQTHLKYTLLTLTRTSGTPGVDIFFVPNVRTLKAASFRLDGSEFTHRNVFWKLDTIPLPSLLSTSRSSKDVWMLPLSSESLCVKTTEQSAAKCTRIKRTMFHAALTGHQDKAVQHSITRY